LLLLRNCRRDKVRVLASVAKRNTPAVRCLQHGCLLASLAIAHFQLPSCKGSTKFAYNRKGKKPTKPSRDAKAYPSRTDQGNDSHAGSGES
jgi:hypothetical protein